MTRLRWELAEKPKDQGALFDEPIFEREPGRGEYRGLEFLHVKAQRIINEVKGAPFGFRYSINPYRGCSHSCAYCVEGSTPILMADGRTKPLADVRPGDRVYGTDLRGKHRCYVPTTVLDHWESVKRAYRVVLEDGTALIASGDHRFLTRTRGWKYVTGTGAGRGQRPHLTTNNELLGVGALPEPPKITEDYKRGYLRGVIRGDGALADAEALQRTRDYLDEFGIPTSAWPEFPTEDWTKGFLAGTFDAEGSHDGSTVRISNANDTLINQITDGLERFGFEHVIEEPKQTTNVRTVRIRGGLPERLRFFVMTDPAITRKRTIDGRAIKSEARLRVVAVEPLGIDLPMYDITTGTGDFIANGVVSHNCFARPTHEYLDLNAGDDFDSKIVVKVNAVSLLEAELRSRRWQGELIAMGTNTDPYQRAEGKYHLTQGILKVLNQRRNPYSILTKSTLVLRDLPLLVEAAQQGLVRVNLSVGTLDEDVWRATEPGTPPPARRLRAVQRLNAAGVPTGVLIAPVLPHLSDNPKQLDKLVKACVDAGARSITPVLLHLRSGVREVFFTRLAGTHPDLLDTYQRQYRNRIYAPRADQEALLELVRDLTAKHGGHLEPEDPPQRTARRPDQGPEPAGAVATPATTQLSLL